MIVPPLVSCVTPTANRRQFLPYAIKHFQRQTYKHLELVVVDDGADHVKDLIPEDDPRIRYVSAHGQDLALGAKRNLACAIARGYWICIWDDDDWHAPWRVGALIDEAYRETDDHDEPVDLVHTWAYQHQLGTTWNTYRLEDARDGSPGIVFGTCMFKRALWEAHPFGDQYKVGEDLAWIEDLLKSGIRTACVRDPSCYVVVNHGTNRREGEHDSARGNTCARTCQVGVDQWKRWRSRGIERLLGEDAGFYCGTATK